MRNLICTIIMLSSGVFNYSHASSQLDSLKREVLNAADDTNKVLQLKDLSYKYLKVDVDKSYKLIKKSIELSERLDYKFGYAASLNQMGLVFKYMSQYDSSMSYYKRSLILFEELDVKSERASILNRMANVYKRFGKFDLSIDCFMQSVKIYKELNDSIAISSVLNNIGIMYNDLGQYEKSLEYQLQSLDIRKKIGDLKGIPITLMNIGNNYQSLNEFDKAILYYKEALDLMGDNGNKYDQAQLVHNIATVHEESGNYKSAKQYYLKAIQLEKELNFTEMLVFSLQGVGNSLIKEGRFKEGEKYLLQSYELAKEIKDIRREHRLSKNLYQAYFKYGDYKNSIQYLKEYVAIEDSIYNLDKKAQLVELEEKFEAEKRERQIAFLEKEKEVQQLEILKIDAESKQKALQRNVLILGILLSLSFIVYFYLENRKRLRINKLLVNQNAKITEQREEIEKQNSKLLESNNTKDQLFQIIAHDLRSPIVSMESITQLIPYWVEEQDYESLQRLSKTLEVSVHNVLSLIDNLLNWALSQQGKFPYKPENIKLKENLQESIDVYLPIAKIKKIDLEFKASKDIMVFADKNMLFTVMRNLLNNAIKFTPEFGKITVGCSSNQQFVKVWVKDSGIGIPKEKKEMVFELASGNTKGTKGEIGTGLGLFFCKEFVHLNNGDIFIESDHNKGTTITFTLPLFNIPEN